MSARQDGADDCLARRGAPSAVLAVTLQRLLKLKTKSQYQTVSVARQDAHDAVEWARKLYEGAKVVVQS